MQIILLTKGTGGDVFPFIAIGQTLQARGHLVTLVTHCLYENLAQSAGMTFIALDTFSEYHQTQQEIHQLLQPDAVLRFHRRYILPRILDECKCIREQIQDSNTLIVSHTTTMFTALLISEILQIPMLLTFPSPYHIKMLPFYTGLLKVLADEFNLLRNSLALPAVTNWNAWLHSFQNAIALWPIWFASPEPDWPTNLSSIGFVLGQTIPSREDALLREVREFCSTGNPCVLITHGTSPALDPAFFEMNMEACLQLGYNALIVTPHLELAQSQYTSQIRWFKSLPFANVLPYVQAIVHHGGIGTGAQALLAAKPQLIMGHGFDRVENALLFQYLGVAEFLSRPKWKPHQIAIALLHLTTSEHIHQQCVKWAEHANNENSLAKACDVIEAITTVMPTPDVISQSFSGSYKMMEQNVKVNGLSAERQKLLAIRLKQKG